MTEQKIMVLTSFEITKDQRIASFLEEQLINRGCRGKNIGDKLCALMRDRRINGKRRDSYIGRDEKIALQPEREINGVQRSNSSILRDEKVAEELQQEMNVDDFPVDLSEDEEFALSLQQQLNNDPVTGPSGVNLSKDEELARVPVELSEDEEFARSLQQQLNNDPVPGPSGVNLSKDEEFARVPVDLSEDEEFARSLQQQLNNDPVPGPSGVNLSKDEESARVPVDLSEDEEFARSLQQQLNNDPFPGPSCVDLSKDEELARAMEDEEMDQQCKAIDLRCKPDGSSSGDISSSDILSERFAHRTNRKCRQSVALSVVNSQKDDNRLINLHQQFNLVEKSARPADENALNVNEAFEKLLNRRRRKTCIFPGA